MYVFVSVRCGYRPTSDIILHYSSFLFLWGRSLTEFEAHWFAILAGQWASGIFLCLFTSCLCWSYSTPPHLDYIGAGDPNSYLHGCTAGMLSTEPFPWVLALKFLTVTLLSLVLASPSVPIWPQRRTSPGWFSEPSYYRKHLVTFPAWLSLQGNFHKLPNKYS